ncbi:hypothetical protein MTP99_001305 [Tenebrio molitor]|nr:hypothetical protein MTP99_001305 [Tenebrio molitor]
MSSSFLSEANKLKNIQMYLEKNDNLLHFSKYSSECDLSEYFVELEITRKSETDQTIKELKDIWKLLDGKKKILQQEDLNAIGI